MARRRGRLIIVSGLPGSGKTTLARTLEHDCPGVRFAPDEWMLGLGVDLFDGEARARIECLQWTVAQRVLELGGTAILEWGTWSRSSRLELHARARELGAAVELRFLDAPPAVLWSRVRDRDMERHLGRRALTQSDIESWADLIERPEADEFALFDAPVARPPSRNSTPDVEIGRAAPSQGQSGRTGPPDRGEDDP